MSLAIGHRIHGNFILAMLAPLLALASCASPPGGPRSSAHHLVAATAPSTQKVDPEKTDWNQVWQVLGHKGVLRGKVYEVVVPRDDLMVNVDGMPIPSDAGIHSVFHIWVCPCQKILTMGEFCLVDYETADVIDALRAGSIYVTSVSTILVEEHPRLVAVRFYGEGSGVELAKTLKAALDCTGDARTVKEPMN